MLSCLVFLCFCCLFGRGLGTHITRIRSIKMDSWSPEQMAIMKSGGNQQCQEFLAFYGMKRTFPIKKKYDSPAGDLYKAVLKARIEGRPEPTELPVRQQQVRPQDFKNRRMEGFGSSPPPDQSANGLGKYVITGVAVAAVVGVVLSSSSQKN